MLRRVLSKSVVPVRPLSARRAARALSTAASAPTSSQSSTSKQLLNGLTYDQHKALYEHYHRQFCDPSEADSARIDQRTFQTVRQTEDTWLEHIHKRMTADGQQKRLPQTPTEFADWFKQVLSCRLALALSALHSRDSFASFG